MEISENIFIEQIPKATQSYNLTGKYVILHDPSKPRGSQEMNVPVSAIIQSSSEPPAPSAPVLSYNDDFDI